MFQNQCSIFTCVLCTFALAGQAPYNDERISDATFQLPSPAWTQLRYILSWDGLMKGSCILLTLLIIGLQLEERILLLVSTPSSVLGFVFGCILVINILLTKSLHKPKNLFQALAVFSSLARWCSNQHLLVAHNLYTENMKKSKQNRNSFLN